MNVELKEYLKKYYKELLIIIFLITVTILVFKIGTCIELQYESSFEEMSKLVFDSSISLVSIWISGYFILIQLYKNTYPMKIIERDFLKKVKLILIYSLINIVIEMLVVIKFNNIISQVYVIILFIINLIIVLYNAYMINRDLTIETYIDKKFKKIERKFENININKKDVDETFKELEKFFEECMLKEEYYVCNNIAEKKGKIFVKLIEKCNEMTIKGEQQNALAESIFEKIIISGIREIKIASKVDNVNFLVDLFKQQEKNIELCFKINKKRWFEMYVKKINLLSKENESKRILGYLYELNYNLGSILLENDSSEFEEFVNEIYEINISLKYIFSDTNINYLGKFIIRLLIKINNDKSNENYKILIKMLHIFTNRLTTYNEQIDNLVIFYQIYGEEIFQNKDKVKDFINVITSTKNRIIDNEKWNSFILRYLNETMEKWKDLGKDNRNKIINLIIELSEKKISNSYYIFLPQYEEIIASEKNNKETINEICTEYEKILIHSVLNENVTLFYYTIKKMEESLINLKKNDKELQISLLKIFMNMLIDFVELNNQKFLEIIINVLDETICKIDKEKNISSGLAEYIIKEISKIIILNTSASENNIITVMNLLFGFFEENNECNFIKEDNKNKKMFYKEIYNIGMKCIENNNEVALREVSNCLGWYIIRSIKNDNNINTDYLIDRTIDLYEIANNMEVTEKTKIFMMTLFTIVGTFCCKDARYEKYLKKIIEKLKKDDFIRIKTAIQLRTKENDMWDDLFDNNTKELTSKFINKIREKQ